jgi:hypothetical protein
MNRSIQNIYVKFDASIRVHFIAHVSKNNPTCSAMKLNIEVIVYGKNWKCFQKVGFDGNI